MRLVLMQPYFFPYLGYFDLINRCDRWIVFDTAQYIQQGWVNRNRVLHAREGWQYITVPVKKHPHTTAIGDVSIDDTSKWRLKMPRQIAHYRKAPYFEPVMDIVGQAMDDPETALARLNVNILDRVSRYLGIAFRFDFLSQMDLDLGPIAGPGDWGLRVCQALGASEYINATGGGELFDPAAFQAAKIRLTIAEPIAFTYACGDYRFEPNLSIIDVLMWNDRAAVKAYLDSRAGR